MARGRKGPSLHCDVGQHETYHEREEYRFAASRYTPTARLGQRACSWYAAPCSRARYFAQVASRTRR